ncbi:MAG: sigma 54-interacting transcriptional regulator [Myxococcaceae bacterium]|nr:sigma 54-interacting transcriptional regulator [Myxococcaceae bacterium]
MGTSAPGNDTLPCQYDASHVMALPHLLVVSTREGDGIGRRYAIGATTVVGRGQDVAVQFDDETVSRQHCTIELDENGRDYRLVDPGSANGTWVNGRPARTQPLANGDLVQVGRWSCLRFLLPTSAEAPLATQRDLELAALHDEVVCLIGPTGSGKTHSATLLHTLSARKKGPFVHLNGADLAGDPNAIKSRLVGHRKGAYTGATEDHVGALFEADGGTLYLDELESTSPEAQAQLLTLLDRKPSKSAFTPLKGSTPSRLPSFRLVVSMKCAPSQTGLREDLLHRVAADLLWLPSLADTPERIDPLATRFVAEAAQRAGVTAELSPDARVALRKERWPGNVRQLESVLTTLVARSAAGLKLSRQPGARLNIDAETLRPYLSARRERAVQAAAKRQSDRSLKQVGPTSAQRWVTCGDLALRRERDHASWEELGRAANVSPHTARSMAAAGMLQRAELERISKMDSASLTRFAAEHRTVVKHVLARAAELGLSAGTHENATLKHQA